METTHVLYRGKKPELLLRMKYLSQEYRVRDGYVVEMTAKDARVLIEKNPVPFSVVLPGNPEHKIPVRKEYPSQMSIPKLVAHAKKTFGKDLDPKEGKLALRNEISRLEEKQVEDEAVEPTELEEKQIAGETSEPELEKDDENDGTEGVDSNLSAQPEENPDPHAARFAGVH